MSIITLGRRITEKYEIMIEKPEEEVAKKIFFHLLSTFGPRTKKVLWK